MSDGRRSPAHGCRETGGLPALPLRRSLYCLALLPALLGLMAIQTPAWGDDRVAEATVCLAKTDETGGKLGFAVQEADAGRFLRAGFTRASCPQTLDRAAAGIGARCARLRQLDPEGHKMIEALYGLSVAAMCDAHDAWARVRPDRQ